MREIRRKNPLHREIGESDALDDVNEQELAKDSDGNGSQKSKRVIRIKRDKPQDVSEKENKPEENSALPLKIEEGETGIVAVPNEKECEEENFESCSEILEEKQVQKTDRKRENALYIAVTVICILASVCALLYSVLSVSGNKGTVMEQIDTPQSSVTQGGTNGDVAAGNNRSLYESVVDSAVTVRVVTEDEVRCASGTVVFSDGYIATVFGAVSDAKSIEVVLRDGRKFAATLVGGEHTSELALLKIDSTELSPISVGEQTVTTGDRLYAVGTLGETPTAALSSSFCSGEVAYSKRQLKLKNGESEKLVNVMQLDGFEGDALGGCPVFDEHGMAIAIMTEFGRDDGGDNTRFAFPISEAMALFSKMRNGDTLSSDSVSALAYSCPKLGVFCETVSEDDICGARIMTFANNECDAARMLREGDVIVKLGDVEIRDTQSLKDQIETKRESEKVEIFVSRNGQILSFYVCLTK
jgi:S1-C subfamily serine protease